MKPITFAPLEDQPADAAIADDAPAPTDAPAADAPADDAPADDAAVDGIGSMVDGPVPDVPPPLGTQGNPARTCAELSAAGMPSAAYWVRTGDSTFQVYCEQQLQGGGWALLENSVRRDDGTTTAFWQFLYADRLGERGTLATDQNYYNGALYLIGREYMDVFVDLQDHTAIAAVMTATGFDPETMRFATPAFVAGSQLVYEQQFAAGWSSLDYDGDLHNPDNCARVYGDIAQHYGTCWYYNLGVDAEGSILDGGVGPHVNDDILRSLGLSLEPGQPEGSRYSQVKRIARFTRW